MSLASRLASLSTLCIIRRLCQKFKGQAQSNRVIKWIGWQYISEKYMQIICITTKTKHSKVKIKMNEAEFERPPYSVIWYKYTARLKEHAIGNVSPPSTRLYCNKIRAYALLRRLKRNPTTTFCGWLVHSVKEFGTAGNRFIWLSSNGTKMTYELQVK